MEKRNIIVIGASAGGFEACKTIVSNLPPIIDAAIFIVWHMSPDVRGVLPRVLSRVTNIPVAHAYDQEPVSTNRIYVAPPDHHMLIEDGHVRVTRGPKENRFRPAVDPLFRSAAYSYSNRVIGVVLTGALDDGTAGLWTIKHYGGIAVVQDPNDAEVPSMPENAIREVAVDHIVPLRVMTSLLVDLSQEEVEVNKGVMKIDEKTKVEIKIAENDSAFDAGIMEFGSLTPFTCPECHGVLSTLKDGDRVRYRCHTGHAHSADSLLTSITENIEDSLYSAMRGVEESMMLLNHMGDHFAESNQPRLAALYFQKASEAAARAQLVRQAVLSHEQLSKDSLWQQAEKLEAEESEQRVDNDELKEQVQRKSNN